MSDDEKTKKPRSSKAAATCVRQIANVSEVKNSFRFDNRYFDAKGVRQDLPLIAPKLAKLVSVIRELDTRDLARDGTLYKHFIDSDVTGSYGAKAVASALIAHGFRLATVPSRDKRRLVLDIGSRLNDRFNNFVILTSTDVFRLPVTQRIKKNIVGSRGTFNSRPDNVFGALVRIVIADSGFKEGVDLFDVRYAHMLEPQISSADRTQAVGRVTRLCGQSGLRFFPGVGWPVDVFEYRVGVPKNDTPDKSAQEEGLSKEEAAAKADKFQFYLHDIMIAKTGVDFNKLRVADEMLELLGESAIDADANAAVNNAVTPESKGSSTGGTDRRALLSLEDLNRLLGPRDRVPRAHSDTRKLYDRILGKPALEQIFGGTPERVRRFEHNERYNIEEKKKPRPPKSEQQPDTEIVNYNDNNV